MNTNVRGGVRTEFPFRAIWEKIPLFTVTEIGSERFMRTLKEEEVYLFEYRDIYEARERIEYFLEDVYNRKRLHSSLGHIPPEELECLTC